MILQYIIDPTCEFPSTYIDETVIKMNSNLYHCNLWSSQMKATLQSARLALVILIILNLQRETIHVVADPELPAIPPLLDNLGVQNNNGLPDSCETCKLLVSSFEKGMERTMRGKHEGGDTSWEEKNLKSYVDSEVRLVEIQEKLCDDAVKNKAHCLYLNEESEQDIEDWWFKHRKNNVRLHDYLCVNKLKRCCSDGSYGPTCQKCPSECNGHGKCDGSGTRSGSGECICSLGYIGTQCESCDENHYQVPSNTATDKFTCMPCHKACKGGCNGPRSANCTECRSGYRRDSVSNSCIDINECELGPNEIEIEARKLCPDGTYCVNTDGHYKCADCHRACSACVGYGRGKCLTCATDYFMDDNHNCVISSENPDDFQMHPDESYTAFAWRFMTTVYWKRLLSNGTIEIMSYLIVKHVFGLFGDMDLKTVILLMVPLFVTSFFF